MIESLQNPYIKYLCKLQKDSKFRKNEKVYIIEGPKLVKEALLSEATIKSIITTNMNLLNETVSLSDNFPIATVSSDCFHKFSQMKKPQGIAAIIEMPSVDLKMDWINPLLICDNISDPGNLGTIIRTVDAMQWPGIAFVNDCADVYSPKTLRSAMGSHFRVPIMNWKITEMMAFKKLNNVIFYGADVAGEPITEWKKPDHEPFALIIGNEAQGISHEIAQICDFWVSVPMPGPTESLNVAIATGILLSHMNCGFK